MKMTRRVSKIEAFKTILSILNEIKLSDWDEECREVEEMINLSIPKSEKFQFKEWAKKRIVAVFGFLPPSKVVDEEYGFDTLFNEYSRIKKGENNIKR